MALVKGTNCAFVAAAPSGDPGEAMVFMDDTAWGMKDTLPAGASKVTELGWWCDGATPESNYEMGIYTHNVGDDNPEAIVGVERTNAKGTSTGWKRVTGLNIAVSAETVYWIGLQLDDTSPGTGCDTVDDAGEKIDKKIAQTTLADPWGASDNTYGKMAAIYAVYETGAAAPAGGAASLRRDCFGGENEPGIYI